MTTFADKFIPRDLSQSVQQQEPLGKRMAMAFSQANGITLSPDELWYVYLKIVRLQDIERFAQASDWESVKAYCPKF